MRKKIEISSFGAVGEQRERFIEGVYGGERKGRLLKENKVSVDFQKLISGIFRMKILREKNHGRGKLV